MWGWFGYTYAENEFMDVQVDIGPFAAEPITLQWWEG